jgi:hypothetical protein
MYDPDAEALWVSDPTKIQQLRHLVAENPHAVEHACGYHWLICFRDRSGNVAIFAHNEECEEYQNDDRQVHTTLRKYFDKIRLKPTEFVFDLNVPADVAPEQMLSRMHGAEELVFFLRGTDGRLPRLRIQLTMKSSIPEDRRQWDRAVERNRQTAIDRMRDVVARIENGRAGIHHSKIDNNASTFGGGEMEDRVETVIYFPYGSATLKESLPSDVRVVESAVPDSYMIQVIGPLRSAAEVKRAVEARIGATVSVTPYPQSTSSE